MLTHLVSIWLFTTYFNCELYHTQTTKWYSIKRHFLTDNISYTLAFSSLFFALIHHLLQICSTEICANSVGNMNWQRKWWNFVSNKIVFCWVCTIKTTYAIPIRPVSDPFGVTVKNVAVILLTLVTIGLWVNKQKFFGYQSGCSPILSARAPSTGGQSGRSTPGFEFIF